MKASNYIKLKTVHVYVMLKTTSDQYSELRMRKKTYKFIIKPTQRLANTSSKKAQITQYAVREFPNHVIIFPYPTRTAVKSNASGDSQDSSSPTTTTTY